MDRNQLALAARVAGLYADRVSGRGRRTVPTTDSLERKINEILQCHTKLILMMKHQPGSRKAELATRNLSYLTEDLYAEGRSYVGSFSRYRDDSRHASQDMLYSHADILKDLLAFIEMGGEIRTHDEMGWDKVVRQYSLAMTTEPIKFEDVELGRFEAIALVGDLSTDCLRIRALEPNNAVGYNGVTHPHVKNGRLCFGNESNRASKALKQGRLLDYFNLVNAVLNTYTANDAYCPIPRWYGVECCECGELGSGRAMCGGNECDNWICGECLTRCDMCQGTPVCTDCTDNSRCQCGNLICRHCFRDTVRACPCCGGRSCRRCRTRCTQCSGRVCSGCINEDGYCGNCQAIAEDERLQEQAAEPAEATVEADA